MIRLMFLSLFEDFHLIVFKSKRGRNEVEKYVGNVIFLGDSPNNTKIMRALRNRQAERLLTVKRDILFDNCE